MTKKFSLNYDKGTLSTIITTNNINGFPYAVH